MSAVRLVDGVQAPGQHEALLPGVALGSGVYLVQMVWGSERLSAKVVVK